MYRAGTILIFQSIQMYVIDTFTLHAASGLFHFLLLPVSCFSRVYFLVALAAVSFFRSLAGFGFPLFAPAM